MGALELVAEYDDFLQAHLNKYGNPGKDHSSYLSHSICDELISLLDQKVRNYVITEINEAKYYSLILDSTPNLSHNDQLSVIIRYVNTDGHRVKRFLQLIPVNGHDSETLKNTTLQELKKVNIGIKNCRGQCYNNTSNMAGIYNGL